MVRAATILLIVYCLSGCTNSYFNEHQRIVNRSTPPVFTEFSKWQFHILDPEGQWLGSMTLAFQEQSVETCTSGDWKKADLLDSTIDSFPMTGAMFTTSGGKSKYAYLVEGAFLWIDLHADICDSNIMLKGELLENGAVGVVRYSTPFPGKNDNGDRGTFTAAPIRNQ